MFEIEKWHEAVNIWKMRLQQKEIFSLFWQIWFEFDISHISSRPIPVRRQNIEMGNWLASSRRLWVQKPSPGWSHFRWNMAKQKKHPTSNNIWDKRKKGETASQLMDMEKMKSKQKDNWKANKLRYGNRLMIQHHYPSAQTHEHNSQKESRYTPELEFNFDE